MKLCFNQIREIITGAVRIAEENGFTNLYRFTHEQEQLYKSVNQDFYAKTFSTAGVRLLFKTDSKRLFLKVATVQSSSRKYFSVDVFVNGNYSGSLDNFSDTVLTQNYVQQEFPLGNFCKEFQLGDGIKTVCVHLPWSVSTSIKQIEIDEGAFIEGIKPTKKLLAFGDSITHGYDALHPSNRYIAKLADKLGAEEFNKAIGGERFFPELAKLKDSFVPDYITVAYGTNDWSGIDKCTFKENCKGFFESLIKNYPESKIFAITPIWRKDMNEDRIFGAFEDVEKTIRECVKGIENITVISGFDFVPKDEKYYADLRLHPNDDGFESYAEHLYNAISIEL